MSKELVEVRELRENGYIVIENEPCKIMSIQTSKPGKHGEAKARIETIGIFDNVKRSVVYPIKHKVAVPNIDKRIGIILSIQGEKVQLMDKETFEQFELLIPADIEEKIVEGGEIQYVTALEKRKIMRL